MKFWFFLVFICFTTPVFSESAVNVRKFLDTFYNARMKKNFGTLSRMIQVYMDEEESSYLKNFQSSWEGIQNEIFLVQKVNSVENQQRVTASVTGQWYGTCFNTGDNLTYPFKTTISMFREGDNLKIVGIEDRKLPNHHFRARLITSLLQRDRDALLQEIQKKLEETPEDPEALSYFGYLMMLEGNLELAAKSFRKVSQKDPLNLPALSFLSQLDKKDYFTQTPENLPNYYYKSLTLNQLGKFPQAQKTCEEGLQKFPDSDLLYVQLGRANKGLGRVKESIEAFQKGVTLAPKSYDSLYNLAEGYLSSQKVSQGLPLVGRGLLLFSGNPGFLFLKTQALFQEKKIDQAQAMLKPFIEKYPNHQPAIRLYEKMGHIVSNR